MNCEIVNKETGDRVNWPAGILVLLGLAAVTFCAGARIYQEIKKHAHKDKPVAVQVERFKPHNCR